MWSDFNTNCSSTGNFSLINSLNSVCGMFSFKQYIKDFTRIASTSTTIDLILVSYPDKISQSGVIDCCISDYLMTFCTRKITNAHIVKHYAVNVGSLKHYSEESF